MGVVTRAVTRAFAPVGPLAILNARRTTVNRTQAMMATTIGRRVMKSTPQIYRNWSIHAPLVRVAMDIRIGQAMLGEWDIVPADEDGPTPDKGLMNAIRERLTVPNDTGELYGEFISRVSEDILALDAGVIEKERTVGGEIANMWPADGARVAVDRFWNGNPRMPRYYWCPTPTDEVPLLNRDLIYTMLHPRSYEPVGISILETLKMSIEAELSGSMFNARQITQAAPDGIMDLGENVRPEQVTSFRAFFEQEIAGKGMIGFWGGTKNAKFIPFRSSNKDAQFIEFLQWEARKIAIGFWLSPQDLGFLQDVNRANAEVQQAMGEDRGTKMWLGKIQNAMTAEVCWDQSYGGMRNNIAFRYRTVSDRASLQKAQELKLALAGMPWETVNGARRKLNLPPIGDPNDKENPFNKLMANSPLGIATIDFVPNAKEIARINAPKSPDGGGAGPGGSKPAASDKAYEIRTPNATMTFSELAPRRLASLTKVLEALEDGEATEDPVAAFLTALATDQRVDRAAAEARLAELVQKQGEAFAGAAGAMADAVKAVAERPEPEIHVEAPVSIAEGAVRVESPVTIAEGAVVVNQPPEPDRVTEFKTDDKGRIVGKVEKTLKPETLDADQ